MGRKQRKKKKCYTANEVKEKVNEMFPALNEDTIENSNSAILTKEIRDCTLGKFIAIFTKLKGMLRHTMNRFYEAIKPIGKEPPPFHVPYEYTCHQDEVAVPEDACVINVIISSDLVPNNRSEPVANESRAVLDDKDGGECELDLMARLRRSPRLHQLSHQPTKAAECKLSTRQQIGGSIEERMPTKALQPKMIHLATDLKKCNKSCISWIETKDEDTIGVSPLATPVLYGFVRGVFHPNNVYYIAPCGRILNNIRQVLRYLRRTSLQISIDLFDFDYRVNIYNEFVVNDEEIILRDISLGAEKHGVQCSNVFTQERPPNVKYITQRQGSDLCRFKLNCDPQFLTGCDCIDNCQDKTKCACWQLTMAENVRKIRGKNNWQNKSIGYSYKRLTNVVDNGIYECNERCKCCVKTCLNRVVQHPLKQKLHLAMTENKGWGLRCVNDIPAGSFICVYLGEIMNESFAEVYGQTEGSEYSAQLDLIEVAEEKKEGYEEYAAPSEHLNDDMQSKNSSLPLGGDSPSSSLRAVAEVDNAPPSRPSLRTYYGKDEEMDKIFIMDAKRIGNIARYINHSCDPNLFVQSVFVDTHDLRFPWVGLFSKKYIAAGEELTWNYAYENLPGQERTFQCRCEAKNCVTAMLPTV